MSSNPLVSVIVPVYNVEKYLRECLDSVVHQTLKDIEIICIDDGSTDGSPRILDEYAEKYPTLKVIHKENGGYGIAMNTGLKHATGEYIGIVESDDYCELNMFESLYTCASENNADAAKSAYFTYWSFPIPMSNYEPLWGIQEHYKVFFPREEQDIFKVAPAIWSGLYKREFLEKNDIRFTETPGASFQDTAFNFKVWACAERAVTLGEAFLHYRQDNEGSSVKSRSKIDYVNKEYAEIERFVRSRPELEKSLIPLMNYLKFNTYQWNLLRLSPDLRYPYYLSILDEFVQANARGEIEQMPHFAKSAWRNFNLMLTNPDEFYELMFGPINPSVTYIFPTGSLTATKSTIKSLQGQKNKDIKIACLLDRPSQKVLEYVFEQRSHDQRIVVFSEPEYLKGELKAEYFGSGALCFLSAGCKLNKDATQIILSNAASFPVYDSIENDKNEPTGDFNLISFYRDAKALPPVVCGFSYSFEGIPICPLSIDTAIPYALCGGEAISIVDGIKVGTKKKPELNENSAYTGNYKKQVDDFKQVCAYGEELLAQNDSARNAFIYRIYSRSSWLKSVYKVMPKDAYCSLEEEYKPSSFLNRVLSVTSSGNSDNSPALSVIIPLYNKEEYIDDCLLSVLSQSLYNLEAICVDDGSNDDSLQKARKWAEADDRVILIEKTNNGAALARNDALRYAKGEYVCFLDADDYYPSQYTLEKLVTAAQKNDADMCGGTLALSYDGEDPELPTELSQRKYIFKEEKELTFGDLQYDYGFVRFIYRLEFLKDNNVWFPDLSWYEDPVFLVRASIKANKIYAIPEMAYVYRQTHTVEEIQWPEERISDLIRGLTENLELSAAHDLPFLHNLTLSRINGEFFSTIKESLASHAIFSLLVDANNAVDVPTLAKAGNKVNSAYIIGPLYECREIARNEGEMAKERKKLRAWTVVPRAVCASPRFARTIPHMFKDLYLKDAITVTAHNITRGLI